MSGRNFLDTNVLVYTDDHDAPAKRQAALELVAECRRQRSGVVSTQTLQEYFVTATRKLGVPVDVARRKTELFGQFDLVRIDLADILAAIDFQRLHGFSFWDCLIVRAALNAGCQRLYSEDMQDGRKIQSPEVVNPFAGL